MRTVNRLQAYLIALIFWAAIYLPGLGSTEIKGEEGRRILPAITMLDGGSWLIPSVGGKPFLRKPPLVNWLIAGAFKLTGVRNEWAARLPSALCVLGLAIGIVATSGGRGWINLETGVVAALFAITQFGLLAKARFAGAEIEGVYAPVSGLAILTWLAFWARGRSPWLTWTLPFVFLGIAALAKGPSLHLLFFYAIVIAVLWKARQWSQLWHPAHGAGLLIAAALFSLWAVPFFTSPEANAAAEVWKKQGIDRFTDSDFNLTNYLLNFPRALMDLLPWVAFAPALLGLIRRSTLNTTAASSIPPQDAVTKSQDLVPAPLIAAIAYAVAGCFVVLLLVPGVLPRYVMPLGGPVAVLLAVALQQLPATARQLKAWFWVNRCFAGILVLFAFVTPIAAAADLSAHGLADALRKLDPFLALLGTLLATLVLAGCAVIIARRPLGLRPLTLTLHSCVLLGLASFLYSVAAVRWINREDDLRPMAANIDAAVPQGKSLVIYDPGYLPALFYLHTPFCYALDAERLPNNTEYVLVRPKALGKLTEHQSNLQLRETFSRKGKPEILLLQRLDGITKDPRPVSGREF